MASGGVPSQTTGVDPRDLEYRIHLYHAYLINNVDATQVVPHLMTDFNRETYQKIYGCSTTREGMEMLMKYLSKKTDTTCWARFLEALKSAKYEDMAEMIQGKNILKKDLPDQERILRIFTGKLYDKLSPDQLCPHLYQNEVITTADMDYIMARQRQEGRGVAVMVLLDRIPRKNIHWFRIFVQVLDELGYKELARDIHPGYRDDSDDSEDEFHDAMDDLMDLEQIVEQTNKLQVADACTSAKTTYDDMSSFHTMEHHVSVHGLPQVTGKNLSPPESSESKFNNFDQSESWMKSKDSSKRKNVENGEQYFSQSDTTANNLNQPDSSMYDKDKIHRKTKNKIQMLTSELEKNDVDVEKERRKVEMISCEDSNDDEDDDEVTREKKIAQQDVNSYSPYNGDKRREGSLSDETLAKFKEIQKEHHEKIGIAPKMNLTHDEPPGKNQEYTNTKEELKLRGDQEDLARPGLQGKNCIIVAPTGSGKTFIAMKIINEHFKTQRRRRHPKVIFLTEQEALAKQQGDKIEKYLYYKVKVITGETQQKESYSVIKEWISRRDILVVTAQLLVNSLIEHDVEITDFSLLVFDECHHAHAQHAYNQIMFRYLDLKLDENRMVPLPQIVGLTASVGVGRAKKLETAVEWIQSMMANLDAEEIPAVSSENESELLSHTQIPMETLFEVPGRRNDRFRTIIVEMMQDTEKMMRDSRHLTEVREQDKVTKPPTLKGSEQYTQWVSELRRETAKVRDQEAARFFLTCRNYLDIFNKTLIMYDYARVKDAIELLNNELKRYQHGNKHNEVEMKMQQYLENCLPILNNCLDDDNPKLTKLKESIDRAFCNQEDSRGIIFAKTRDLVRAIVAWMKDVRGLKELNPAPFVSTHASGEEGLTKTEQSEILELFRKGGHKIIVSTSVADEGLDIQECNLVIKYHQVTNEIAMVQRRGRARKKESQVILFHEAGSGIAEKEELNMLREVMMNKAMKQLRGRITENPEEFKAQVLDIQKRDKAKRDLEARIRHGRVQREGDFEMNCGRCRSFICMSNEIRLIQRAHHAAVCEDIMERITAEVTESHYSDTRLKSGVGKVKCQQCDYDLGNISVYENAQFFILKIASFSVQDVHGAYDTYKRWKKVPFHVRDIREQEVEERLKGEKYIDSL